MKSTKTITREDIRDLWRRYQRGDMSAGNDFTAIAHAQGKTFKTLKAEIEPECRLEDQQPVSKTTASSDSVPEYCSGKEPKQLGKSIRSCPAGRHLGSHF